MRRHAPNFVATQVKVNERRTVGEKLTSRSQRPFPLILWYAVADGAVRIIRLRNSKVTAGRARATHCFTLIGKNQDELSRSV